MGIPQTATLAQIGECTLESKIRWLVLIQICSTAEKTVQLRCCWCWCMHHWLAAGRRCQKSLSGGETPVQLLLPGFDRSKVDVVNFQVVNLVDTRGQQPVCFALRHCGRIADLHSRFHCGVELPHDCRIKRDLPCSCSGQR